ncbi:TAP-like protein-domain-containing protein [Daedaleopsis nitida]|nr:TAP-like protein-domain-containing protein [Daedaleopsis nitida]
MRYHSPFVLLALPTAVLALSAGRPWLSRDNAPSPQSVQWAPCDPSFVPFQTFPVDCAFFEIPLDYHDPSAGTGRLSLIKVNATGQRKGTLFMNPGGPGVSGVSFIAGDGMMYLNKTGGNYDIVSWDPRGVGLDTIPSSVICYEHLTDYITFIQGTIEELGIGWFNDFTDPQDIARLLAQAPQMQEQYEQVTAACLQSAQGGTLQYVGTAANARDLAALADALDGPGSPVNYWGISYGTLLGAWLPQTLAWGDKIQDGVGKVYRGFTDACALAGPSNCNLTSETWTGQDVRTYFEHAVNTAHEAELQPNGTSGIASNLMRAITTEAHTDTSSQYVRRRILRAPHTPITDGRTFASEAITCGDSVDPKGTTMEDVFRYLIDVTQKISPTFGAIWPIPGFHCPFWSVRAVERYTGPFNKTLANQVLVIGNAADPITPFAQAKELADLMGDNAVLVQQRGFGHATFAGNSQCVTDIIRNYLNNNMLPENDDTVCEMDADEEVFPGVTSREAIALVDP